jgi:hypothetical protein
MDYVLPRLYLYIFEDIKTTIDICRGEKKKEFFALAQKLLKKY